MVQDELSDTKIAARCKVTRRTLATRKLAPDFKQRLEQLGELQGQGAEAAARAFGFETVERLITLARMDPTGERTTSQVAASRQIARLRREQVPDESQVYEQVSEPPPPQGQEHPEAANAPTVTQARPRPRELRPVTMAGDWRRRLEEM